MFGFFKRKRRKCQLDLHITKATVLREIVRDFKDVPYDSDLFSSSGYHALLTGDLEYDYLGIDLDGDFVTYTGTPEIDSVALIPKGCPEEKELLEAIEMALNASRL